MLTLAGLALRAARLDFQPLWWDEGYSVWFATHSLGQMAALTAEDIHPPLYYALLHGWTLLFGAGPVALRLLSVLFGALAIPAIYGAGRRIFANRGVALLAALLLTFNPLHIFYSQEIRMYGLVALLSIGVIAAAWRVFAQTNQRISESANQRTPRHRVTPSPCHLVAYILLATLALYTQYYAAFLPIGLTSYAAWRWRHDLRALARWLAAQAIVALLYLPWVLYAAPKLALYVSQKVVADADKPLGPLAYLARHLAAFLVGHLEGPLAAWWPAALALLLPLTVGWWLIATRRMANQRISESASQRVSESANQPSAISHQLSALGHQPSTIGHRTSSILLATVLLTALALGWLISLRAPFFPARGERLLILALPAFVLLAAAGLDALWRRWRIAGYVACGLVVAASAASLAAFYTVPRYADNDYRALIAHTVEQGLPGDTVFCVYPWQVGYWRAYAPASDLAARLSPSAEWNASVSAALDDALATGRVWFPAHLSLGAILETDIEAHLADRGLPFVNEWHGPNTRLSAWANAATNFTNFTNEDPGIQFALSGGGTLMLQAIAGSTTAVPAANAVTPIALTWQADASPPVLAVSVRLTDNLGQIWAQHDYEPTRRDVACNVSTGAQARWCATDRLGLLVPAGTPPGRYRVELVLRPKGSERPLDALGPDGRVLGPAARLYELEVSPADRPLTADRLPIAQRRLVELGDGLRFLGFSADAAPLAPGDLRKVNLFWQAHAQPTSDYVAFVQLLPRGGNAIPVWEAPPGAAVPTSAWAAGTLMRTQAAFRAPAGLPDGRYRLIAGLYRPADGARLRGPDGRDYITLGQVMIRGRDHTMTPPAPQHVANTTFGSLARLVGYDVALPAGGVVAGGALSLTLHWQALAAADRPYTVFVHLVDETGAVRGYGDTEPGGGRFPTPGWLAGEYLADEHVVTVAADAPAGIYRLVVGFYDPATGERLQTSDGADQVVLEAEISMQ